MANKLDPHHLVALMSYAIGKNQGSPSRPLPLSIKHQYCFPIPHKTRVHTFSVLDAIASICVFEERSQVFAVALQLNHKERKIRLTLAENQEVEPRVVDHLKSVWGMLQALSTLAEFTAKGGSDEYKEGLPLRVRIFREIYQYSLKKQMKQVQKWWSPLLDFSKELDQRRGHNLQGFELDLTYVVAELNSVLELTKELSRDPVRGLTDDQWKTVHDHSMAANDLAGHVLANRNHYRCKTLAQELNGMPP